MKILSDKVVCKHCDGDGKCKSCDGTGDIGNAIIEPGDWVWTTDIKGGFNDPRGSNDVQILAEEDIDHWLVEYGIYGDRAIIAKESCILGSKRSKKLSKFTYLKNRYF